MQQIYTLTEWFINDKSFRTVENQPSYVIYKRTSIPKGNTDCKQPQITGEQTQ